RISAVAVDDQDLLEAVSRDLGAGGVEQVPDEARWKREGARLMARLVNLAVKIVWEDDGVLLFHRASPEVTRLDQIGADRCMWPVLLEDADGQNGRLVGFLERLRPVAGGELIPPRWQILGRRGGRNEEQQAEHEQTHGRDLRGQRDGGRPIA